MTIHQPDPTPEDVKPLLKYANYQDLVDEIEKRLISKYGGPR